MCVVFVAALTSSCGRDSAQDALFTGDPETTASTVDPLGEAKRICSSFEPPGDPTAQLFGFQLTTISEVNRSLSVFDIDPIDPNAFEDGAVTATSPLARCSYLGEPSANSPTTICEDGSIHVLEQPLQFLVSETGTGIEEQTEHLDAIHELC